MTNQQRIRFSDALQRIGGDEETLVMLSTMAAEDAPELLDQMNDQLGNQQWGEYAKTAHSLKGLLTTFETNEPVSEIQELIDEARIGNGKAVRSGHAKTERKLLALVQEINELNES